MANDSRARLPLLLTNTQLWQRSRGLNEMHGEAELHVTALQITLVLSTAVWRTFRIKKFVLSASNFPFWSLWDPSCWVVETSGEVHPKLVKLKMPLLVSPMVCLYVDIQCGMHYGKCNLRSMSSSFLLIIIIIIRPVQLLRATFGPRPWVWHMCSTV